MRNVSKQKLETVKQGTFSHSSCPCPSLTGAIAPMKLYVLGVGRKEETLEEKTRYRKEWMRRGARRVWPTWWPRRTDNLQVL